MMLLGTGFHVLVYNSQQYVSSISIIVILLADAHLLEELVEVLVLVLEEVDLVLATLLIRRSPLVLPLLENIRFASQLTRLHLQVSILSFQPRHLFLQGRDPLLSLELFLDSESDTAGVEQLIRFNGHSYLVSHSHQQQSSLRTIKGHLSNEFIETLRVELFTNWA